ncbi:hypothetical protein C8J57DRAFT_1080684, partial [Mycena rebaudengoi]
TPDIYLHKIQAELRELCNIDTSHLTIWRALGRRRFTRKQVWVSRMAAQRDDNARANYQIHMTTAYRPDQLVFVDESACNCFTTK